MHTSVIHVRKAIMSILDLLHDQLRFSISRLYTNDAKKLAMLGLLERMHISMKINIYLCIQIYI